MPLNTKAESRPGRTSFHGVLHKVFLDARKNMHLASKAEGMAEFLLEECVKARKKADTTFTNLSQAAQEGELSPSIFKDLSDAGTGLQEQDTLLKEAEAKFEAAKQKSAADRRHSRKPRIIVSKLAVRGSMVPGMRYPNLRKKKRRHGKQQRRNRREDCTKRHKPGPPKKHARTTPTKKKKSNGRHIGNE
jgi:hypothetical protein